MMYEDPENPQKPERDGEDALPEANQPPEPGPDRPGQGRESGGRSGGTGEFIRRMTSSLRRLAGSKSDRLPSQPLPPLSPAQPPAGEQLPPDEPPVEPGASEPGGTGESGKTGEFIHRVTGERKRAGDEPEQGAGEPPAGRPETGEFIHRGTTPLRRATGSVEPPDMPPTPPEPPEAAPPGSDLPSPAPGTRKGQTGEFIERITGPIRRTGGIKENTDSLRSALERSVAEAPPEPPTREAPPSAPREPAEPDWIAEIRQEAGVRPPVVDQPPVEKPPAADRPPGLQTVELKPEDFEEPSISQPGNPGWVAEIREEAGEPAAQEPVAPEAPPEPRPPKRKSVTGQLISLITSSLGGGREKREPAAGEAPDRPRPVVDEYVSDLRQSLATEEVERVQKQSTGNFIQRLTGALRRTTGNLEGGTARSQPAQPMPGPEPPPEPAAPEADLEEGFLVDRLGGPVAPDAVPIYDLEASLAPAPEAWPPAEEDLTPPEGPEPDWPSFIEPVSLEGPQEGLAEGPVLSEEEVLFYLQNSDLNTAEPVEKEADQSGSDWVMEIRQEAAGEETEGPEAGPEAPPETDSEGPLAGMTGSLRSLITGMIKGQEEKRGRPGSQEMPDDVLTGRLERSLGLQPDQPAGAPSEAPLLEEDALLPDAAPPAESAAVDFDEDLLLAGLEARFGQVAGAGTTEEQQQVTLTPEEEELLSTMHETGPLTPEPPEALVDEQPDLEARLRPPERIEADDAYAAAFLTGVDYVPPQQDEEYADTLLRDVLSRSKGEEGVPTFEDVRSIALEDYQEAELPADELLEEPPAEPVVEETGVRAGYGIVLEEEPEEAPPQGFKAWLAARTPFEKVLLVEAVIVAVALVVAVPFFIFMMLRGPVTPPQAVSQILPRALPPDVPYPTGLTLPGGWFFQLNKSTFVNGEWKPSGGEWLEGTELRRVVALPWNRQTEAVVQSFVPGDIVELYLSNDNVIRFKVASVERVLKDEVQVFIDRRPSLAIILYQEDSDERWVVYCRR